MCIFPVCISNAQGIYFFLYKKIIIARTLPSRELDQRQGVVIKFLLLNLKKKKFFDTDIHKHRATPGQSLALSRISIH